MADEAQQDTGWRQFAIDLLNDEHGINKQAFEFLADLLEDTGNGDIVESVESSEGRYYLPEVWSR